MSERPQWLDGLTHHDFLLDGGPCSEEVWNRIDWGRAYVDMGPSPAGNLGPYWHIPVLRSDDPKYETVHRLYPKLLLTKWLPIVRQAVAETAARPLLHFAVP